MKKTALFILFTLSLTLTFAQKNTDENQAIQLNDGSILYGKIIEKDTELDLIKVELKSGGTVIIPLESILSAKKDNEEYHLTLKGKFIKTKGWYLLPQFYTLVGKKAQTWREDNPNRYAVGASFSAGFQFKNYFGIGAGLGIDVYEEILMPVFIDVRGNLGKGNITPYYAFQTGYSFPIDHWLRENEWGETPKGGFQIYPAMGLKFAGKNKINFQMDIGYNFQNHRREIPNWWDDFVNTEKVWFKSLAFRAGIGF